MLGLHKPTRGIRPDRQHGQGKRSEPFTKFVEDPAVPVGRISRTVDVAQRRFEHKAAPKRHALVSQPARRPVVRRHNRYAQAIRQRKAFPPVARCDLCRGQSRTDHGIIAKRGQQKRAVRLQELPNRRKIHVIVVIVRQQNGMDWR